MYLSTAWNVFFLQPNHGASCALGARCRTVEESLGGGISNLHHVDFSRKHSLTRKAGSDRLGGGEKVPGEHGLEGGTTRGEDVAVGFHLVSLEHERDGGKRGVLQQRSDLLRERQVRWLGSIIVLPRSTGATRLGGPGM